MNVQITWSSHLPLTRTDIQEYEIYRAVAGGGYTTAHLHGTVAWTGAATYSWTDTTAHGDEFEYYVVAKSKNGNYGVPSDAVRPVLSTKVQYNDGVPLESLKPAQAGADATTGKSITVLTDRTADNITESGSRKWAAESGATVGATWGTNLNGQPQDLQNLILKPIFEDGSMGKWGTATVAAASGQPFSKYLQITHRDTYEVGNTFPVNAGESLFIGAYVDTTGLVGHPSDGHAWTLSLGCFFTDKSGAVVNWGSAFAIAPSQAWTLVKGRITVPANAVKAEPWIGLERDDTSGGTAYAGITQMFIGRYDKGAEQNNTGQGNLVYNGGFEYGDNRNWDGHGEWTTFSGPNPTAAVVIADSHAAEGGYLGRFGGDTITAAPNKLIPVNTSKRYYMEARIDRSGSVNINMYLGFACFDENKNYIAYSPAGATFNYFPSATNIPTPAVLTTYSMIAAGEEAGTNATSALKFRHGTKYIVPICLFNRDVTGGGTYLDYFKIWEIDTVMNHPRVSSLDDVGALDFSLTHRNKHLGNIADTSTYLRMISPPSVSAASQTSLTQSGTSTTINVGAGTYYLGNITVSVNSGSVNPGAYGTWYVYFDDPGYVSGAMSYQATTDIRVLTQNPYRFYVGKIVTSAGGGGTGGGTGNPCFSGPVGIQVPEGFAEFGDLPTDRPFKIVNQTGVHFAELIVHENYKGLMIQLAPGKLVTLSHLMKVTPSSTDWIPASHKYEYLPRVWFEGTVYNLHVLDAKPDDQHYILFNGDVAHNQKIQG